MKIKLVSNKVVEVKLCKPILEMTMCDWVVGLHVETISNECPFALQVVDCLDCPFYSSNVSSSFAGCVPYGVFMEYLYSLEVE